MNQEPDFWKLTDNSCPEFMRTGAETISIKAVQQLVTMLEHFAQGPPGDLILKSPQGQVLLVGIGGPSARILFYRETDSNHGLIAKPPLTFHDPAYFPDEGQASRTDPEYLMTPETAIRLVSDFYQTGDLPSWMEWEEE